MLLDQVIVSSLSGCHIRTGTARVVLEISQRSLVPGIVAGIFILMWLVSKVRKFRTDQGIVEDCMNNLYMFFICLTF